MRVSKDGVWWISEYKAISTLTKGFASASGGKWSMIKDSWPMLILKRYSTYGLERGSARNLMFFVRLKTCNATKSNVRRPQKRLLPKSLWTPLPDIIENHPRRQPLYCQRANLGAVDVAQSSIYTLAQCQCCVKTSSQTINFASRSNSAKSLCTSIKHIESLPMVIEILKIECEVHPPSNRKTTMPEEATLMATCPSHRTDANNTLYTKVLLDPPGLSRKNIAPSPWATTLNIIVIAISWQMLSHGRF